MQNGNKVTATDQQTIFDISIQQYGSIEGSFDILSMNQSLNNEIDCTLNSGDTIITDLSGVLDKPVVDYLSQNLIRPATEIVLV